MEFHDGSHGDHLVFRSGTNFESNLSYLVPYHPGKFQIDWLKHLRVRFWKQNFNMAAMAPTSKAT